MTNSYVLFDGISCRLQQASVVSCTVLLLIMGTILSCLQFWYTSGMPTIQSVYFLLQTVACAALLAFLIIRRTQDSHLLWLAYALLALCAVLCIVSLPLPIHGWANTASSNPTSIAPTAKPLASRLKTNGDPAFKSAASTDNMFTTRAPKGTEERTRLALHYGQ